MQQYSQTKSGLVDLKAYPRSRTTQQDMIIKDEISAQNLYFFHPHLKIEIPYPLETVAAGFPSPAQDYTEKKIDLNEHLIHNPIATFILKVNSLSMKNAGIEIGDEIMNLPLNDLCIKNYPRAHMTFGLKRKIQISPIFIRIVKSRL